MFPLILYAMLPRPNGRADYLPDLKVVMIKITMRGAGATATQLDI